MRGMCYRESRLVDDKWGGRIKGSLLLGGKKVLLKRKHWHQSVIANWTESSKKSYNYIVPVPVPTTLLGSRLPPSENGSRITTKQPKKTKNKAQWQSHRTINNTFQVGGAWIVMTSSDSYGTSFPLHFRERQKSDSSLSFHKTATTGRHYKVSPPQ